MPGTDEGFKSGQVLVDGQCPVILIRDNYYQYIAPSLQPPRETPLVRTVLPAPVGQVGPARPTGELNAGTEWRDGSQWDSSSQASHRELTCVRVTQCDPSSETSTQPGGI